MNRERPENDDWEPVKQYCATYGISMPENPDVMATISVEGLGGMKQIIFVPRSEIRAYKARYGDRIEFWEVKEGAFD